MPAPSSLHPSPPTRRKSGSEFILVAVIAVVVLVGGGWFIMKTRAENAEKARLAAEAKAEADRKSEEARLAAEAEQKRLAEERRQADLAREQQAAAAKAEQERLDRLAAEVRVGLAEAQLQWEWAEREQREAERRLADLRSELRSLRDAPEGERTRLTALTEAHERHGRWLSGFLADHPARRLRVRTEQFLGSRQIDEAAVELAALAGAIESVRAQLGAAREEIEAPLYGRLVIRTEGPVESWVLVDAFGVRFEGTGEQAIDRVAAGEATARVRRPGWPDQPMGVKVAPRETNHATLRLLGSELVLAANVPGAEAWRDGRLLGRLPLRLTDIPPEAFQLEVRAEGHVTKTESIALEGGRVTELNVVLSRRIPTEQELVDDFTRRTAGVWIRRGQGLPGTGYLLITAGSREVVSKGKFFGASHVINLRLQVPDPRNPELNLVDAASGRYLGAVISLVDGQVVVAANGSSQRFVPGKPSDW